MIRNIFIFLIYFVRENILQSMYNVQSMYLIVEWCGRSAFGMSGDLPHTCFLLTCIKNKVETHRT